MFLPWTVITMVKMGFSITEEMLSSLPFWEEMEETPKWHKILNLDLPFSNVTNVNILFMHIYALKKNYNRIHSLHICWFGTNLCGQMEETKIDLF